MGKPLAPEDVVVIIPSEKMTLSDDEGLSVAKCRDTLARYQIVLVVPQKFRNVDFPAALQGLRIEYFPDRCFRSTRS
jgi:hypothetical protein